MDKEQVLALAKMEIVGVLVAAFWLKPVKYYDFHPNLKARHLN